MIRKYGYSVDERFTLTQAFKQRFAHLSLNCDDASLEEMVVEVEDFYYELLRINEMLRKIEST